MRYLFLILFAVSGLPSLYAQTPAVDWALKMGGNGQTFGEKCATDQAGNCYVAGAFRGSASFGSVQLTSTGGSGWFDAFLAKFDANGTLVWVRHLGGYLNQSFEYIEVDSAGYTYVLGVAAFPVPVIFGSDTLTGNGSEDLLLAKYDPAGNPVWARQIIGSNDLSGNGLTIDKQGNCYLTGRFNMSVDLGSISFQSNNNDDALTAKYSPAGTLLWARQDGELSDESGSAIGTDSLGNVYVLGYFSDSITFGSTTLYDSAYGHELFILKLDPAGNVLWAKKPGGNEYKIIYLLEVDPAGSFTVGGYFVDSLRLGADVFYSQGQCDHILARFDANGNYLWGKAASGVCNIDYRSLGTDKAGNLFLSGNFSDSITFGTTTLVTDSNFYTTFLVKYDTLGNLIWTKKVSTAGNAVNGGLASDEQGNLYLTGYFDNTVIMENISLTCSGQHNAYLVILSPAIPTANPEGPVAAARFILSPNPARTIATISYTLPTAAQQAELSLLELATGRTVQRHSLAAGSTQQELDLSGLSSGLYACSLSVKAKVVGVRKLAVVR